MSAPPAPTTIRAIAEAMRDDNAGMPGHTARRSFDRALAILKALDEASYTRRDGWPTTRYAYIRDPMHPDDAPDPLPAGSAGVTGDEAT